MSNYGKTVKVNYIGTFEDGTVFDSTERIEPLEFVVGSGSVINGFDEAVNKMKLGDTIKVEIPPFEAYGLYDDAKIEIQPMYAIPNAKDIKVGKTFYFITQEGLRFPAKVLEIQNGMAKIDFNHPLAGKTLFFEINLLELSE